MLITSTSVQVLVHLIETVIGLPNVIVVIVITLRAILLRRSVL